VLLTLLKRIKQLPLDTTMRRVNRAVSLIYSTVKAAARPPYSKLFQFAQPNVAVADWMIVHRRPRETSVIPARPQRPHVMAGRAAQLDGTLIFCYTVWVEKCVQKAGDSSRFFLF
jgi:hypothetical protein